MVLIDKFGDDQSVALFYVRKTVENGWSRAMLENNIASNLHLRQGNAETNFDLALTDPDSDLAKETLKDPYDFSFIAMDEKYREEELKTELIKNIEGLEVSDPNGGAWVMGQCEEGAFGR